MPARKLVVALLALWVLSPALSACAIPIIGAYDEPTASPERSRRVAPPHVRHETERAREPTARRATAPRVQEHERPPEPPEPRSGSRFALSIARPLHDGPMTCYDQLERAGVRFERVERDDASGIAYPTRLLGPIGGVEIAQHAGKGKRPPDTLLDCRLALRILAWSKVLRRAHVRSIEHFSTYRPGARVGGDGKVSGHARGLALDAALFHLDDGRVVEVLTDWEDRSGEPCPQREDEAWPSRLLRGIVCEAVDENLFQVVITPHHDSAHENHVHLELRPDVDWTYVR